jgi:hypothetical protein
MSQGRVNTPATAPRTVVFICSHSPSTSAAGCPSSNGRKTCSMMRMPGAPPPQTPNLAMGRAVSFLQSALCHRGISAVRNWSGPRENAFILGRWLSDPVRPSSVSTATKICPRPCRPPQSCRGAAHFSISTGAGRRPERTPYIGRKRIQTGVADRTDSGEPSASSGRAARTSVMMAAAAGAPLQPLRAGADAMAARRRRPASMPDSRRALEPVCISLPVSLRRYASPRPGAAASIRFVCRQQSHLDPECRANIFSPKIIEVPRYYYRSNFTHNFITGFITLGYSKYTKFSTADILVIENIVSLYASKYCATWMWAVEEMIFNDLNLILFQLHRSKQGSSEIS